MSNAFVTLHLIIFSAKSSIFWLGMHQALELHALR